MRFFLTCLRDGRKLLESVNVKGIEGALAIIVYHKRFFWDALDNIIDTIEFYSKPSDPLVWDILFYLYPQHKKKLEAIMVDRLSKVLSGQECEYEQLEPPF